MIRTQIYLQEEQAYAIAQIAKREKKPQAQILRDAVDTLIARKNAGVNAGTSLLNLAKLGERLGLTSDDPHLSRNIDTYLYGE